MKFKTYVFIASLVLLEVAAGSKDGNFTEGINPGDLAPELIVKEKEGNSNIKFANSEGRFTFVNFWAAYDAESRLSNILFCKEANAIGSNKLKIYSISMDANKSVYDATIKADNLDKSQQYWNQTFIYPDILKEYSVNKQVKNLLIDDKGIIIGRNLKPSELANILNQA